VDPLWPGESKYAYVEGNPANWVDPSGWQLGLNEWLPPYSEEEGDWFCRGRKPRPAKKVLGGYIRCAAC
jgi:hypothetical protein